MRVRLIELVIRKFEKQIGDGAIKRIELIDESTEGSKWRNWNRKLSHCAVCLDRYEQAGLKRDRAKFWPENRKNWKAHLLM